MSLAERVADRTADVAEPRRRRGGAWPAVAGYAATALVLVVLNFALPRALPGKPIEALADPRSTSYIGDDARRATVEAHYGLDRPLAEQFGTYLADLARGDLGTSIRYNAPVAELLAERLPWTLLLLGTSLALATAVGLLGGIESGWRRGRAADAASVSLVVAIQNVPVFFVASTAAYVFAVKLGWFPLSGARTPFSESWGPVRQVVDVLHHLALPALVMAAEFVTLQFLVMRASVVTELGAGYLLLGRAKGLREVVLKYRYAGRNALVPAASVIALQAGFAVTAAIFVEVVFAYPGLGRLMFEAVGARDYPTIQGVFLLLGAVVLAANGLADLVSRRLDPRTVE